MKVKVVLKRATLDLLWASGDPSRRWVPGEIPLGADEAIIELDEEVVACLIDLTDETLDEAVCRLVHIKATGEEEAS